MQPEEGSHASQDGKPTRKQVENNLHG